MINQFGSRFALKEEIHDFGKTVNLREDSIAAAGLPLMSEGDNITVCDNDSHNLIIGGTGSKKNRLLLFLTVYLLAKRGESICIFDPKGGATRFCTNTIL